MENPSGLVGSREVTPLPVFHPGALLASGVALNGCMLKLLAHIRCVNDFKEAIGEAELLNTTILINVREHDS